MKQFENLSKEISYALRHAPWEYELEMDEKGKRIVGGTGPNYSTDDLGWLDFNNKEIMIRSSKENRTRRRS